MNKEEIVKELEKINSELLKKQVNQFGINGSIKFQEVLRSIYAQIEHLLSRINNQ